MFLTLEAFDPSQVEWLKEHAGVVLDELLYPSFTLDEVERQKEGMVEIANAIRENGRVVISEDALPPGVKRLPV